MVSSLLARGVAALLHAIKFNDLARRSGFADFVQQDGRPAGRLVGLAGVVKWFVRLITLVVAFDLLGLPAVSVGAAAAPALAPEPRRRARGTRGRRARRQGTVPARPGTAAEAGLQRPRRARRGHPDHGLGFTIVAAVNQLGIATTVIDTLLVGVVGALALAAGLAFGLGGRDKAAEILDRLGQRAERTGPKLERAAPSARGQAHRVVGAARNAEFDESWIPRSGKDRRRVPRPGIDRRVAAAGT